VATLEIVARVVVSNTTLTNIANVTSDTYNPNPDRDANVTVTVPPAAYLVIDKVVNETVVDFNDTVRFVVSVTKGG
jgi:hypothetical protein